MKFPRIFKPRAKGLCKVLGDLETEIMNIIWRQKRASVRDVQQALLKSRDIAYTTVMTVMGRLAEKGLLKKERVENKYVYYPQLSREEILDLTSREVLSGLLDEDCRPVLSCLVDVFEQLPRQELEKLKECVEKALQEQKKEGKISK